MNNKIFTEENGAFQFDFTNADWATDELNNIFHDNQQIWCDTDFVAEYISSNNTHNLKLLFVEYKNANIVGAQRPDTFNPLSDKKINNVARKYLDSLSYFLATNDSLSEKQNYYVYIVEYPNSDSTTRRLLRNKIAQRLPFHFQNASQFKHKLIERFEVLSIEEWNNHPEYSKFPITRLHT